MSGICPCKAAVKYQSALTMQQETSDEIYSALLHLPRILNSPQGITKI